MELADVATWDGYCSRENGLFVAWQWATRPTGVEGNSRIFIFWLFHTFLLFDYFIEFLLFDYFILLDLFLMSLHMYILHTVEHAENR